MPETPERLGEMILEAVSAARSSERDTWVDLLLHRARIFADTAHLDPEVRRSVSVALMGVAHDGSHLDCDDSTGEHLAEWVHERVDAEERAALLRT